MNSKVKIGLIIAVIISLADICLYNAVPLNKDLYIVYESSGLGLSLALVFASFYAFRFHGHRSMQGRALLLMVIGEIFWFFALFSYIYQGNIHGFEMFDFTISDIFWFVGYLFLGAGLYNIFVIVKPPRLKTKHVAALGLFLFLTLVNLCIAYPAVAGLEAMPIVKWGLILYIIADFILLSIGVLIILSTLDTKTSRPWMVIVLGLLLSAVIDVVMTDLRITNLFEAPPFVFSLWDISLVIGVFGYFYYRQTMEDIVRLVSKKNEVLR